MNNRYNEINNSYKKKLVYHLGSEAGFFSEYNNMILAMLYCLKNRIRFELFSKDANFGIANGWEDYFKPFCNESSDFFHAKLNHRHPKQLTLKNKLLSLWYKITTKTNFLTYEIWPKFRNKDFENEEFKISSLNINGDVRDAAGKLIDITWKYNKPTESEVNNLIESLQLPEKYVGIHIRGGDKFIEWEKIKVDTYMKVISADSSIKNVFVLTDDNRVIVELSNKYSTYSFYSLCNKEETGYYHADFEKVSNEQKRKDMVKLFASMDILANSQLFVGTFSSNPGMYLGMRMDIDKVKGVDFDQWCIW